MSEATTTSSVDYFNLPRPLCRKLKKCLPKNKRRTTKGGRPRASERAVSSTPSGRCCGPDASGRPSTAIGLGSAQAFSMRTLPVLQADGHLREADRKRMAHYYARECGAIGWKWQRMDSEHSAAPLGGQKVGKNPTDRGNAAAKINLLVDERGAPISIVLTGANRHDTKSRPPNSWSRAW
jgi:hypothetical protein